MKKVAAIVGGGRSLGAFLSEYLAKNGYRVAILDINSKNADNVSAKIIADGGEAKGFSVDACNDESVNNAFDDVVKHFGTLDLMVYNAGVAKSAKISEFASGDFKLCLDINLVGYFLCARKAAQIMIESETKGKIIQINSKSGKVGSKFNAGYSAAKFGAVGLTQSMALDLAEHRINVNSLMLGNLLNSDMFRSLIPSYAKKLGIAQDKVIPSYVDKVPLKRGCDFQDVANVLLFYASEKASYCTGQSINITGGQVMF